MKEGFCKANFDVDEKQWLEFNKKVMNKEGSQKKGDVLRRFVKGYIEGTIVV